MYIMRHIAIGFFEVLNLHYLEAYRMPIILCLTLMVANKGSAADCSPTEPSTPKGATTAKSAAGAKNAAAESPQPLPMVRLPTNLNKDDKQAIALVSQISILPIAKGVFPDYRPRAYAENESPISAWTVQEYKEIAGLQSISEPLRQLPSSQLMAMESKLGGINKHGMLTDLKMRTTDTYQNVESINIDPDNADSLLAAMPPSWGAVAERVKQINGNHSQRFEIAKWKANFGEAQTNKVLSVFSKLEREKGRPREVIAFGLLDDNWQDQISILKQQLKPLGYEAFARQTECHRRFFSSCIDAENYAKSQRAGTASKVVQEGPAQLVIDREANVISTSGQVERRELDAASKKRCEELENQSKFIGQILGFFGMKGFGVNQKFVGIRFQFNNYPTNWIPPQTKIEKLPNNHLKFTIPTRFAVTTKAREAFAVKDFDQYRYLVAQGITAINYGMSGKDVIAQLRRWDKQYGLSILKAEWDSVEASLERMPPDPEAFEREVKQFCPAAGNPDDLEILKNKKLIAFWWD